ncbi:MAG TPA: four helix bundle protein [Planctomycetota bacterium]|nr:four helix bundle protein [Planctomycetota bacterium]
MNAVSKETGENNAAGSDQHAQRVVDRHIYLQDFRNVKVWRRSHELTLVLYKSVRRFRKGDFEIASQMKRAAISVESNIAEGSSRSTDSDYRRFLFMAMGSLSELHCQVILAKDLSLIVPAEFGGVCSLIVEVRRMLWSLIGRLNQSIEQDRAR